MNLVINPWGDFDSAAQAWLPGYIRSVYDEILPLAQRVIPSLLTVADPWASYTGTLEVYIHPNAFYANGQYNGGLTGWFAPNGNSLIQIAWDIEMGAFGSQHHPLRHEFGHWLGCQGGSAYWGDFGHATANDPLMNALKADVLNGYYLNYIIQHS